MKEILRMDSITKTFPGVLANSNVTISLQEGEILTLLGENGAGKTTLMNILYGLYRQDSGQIFLDGEEFEIKTPSEAIRHGIGMIHQHFMLVPVMTVAENIILGSEPRRGWEVDYAAAKARIGTLSDTYGLKIDPDARINQLSVGQQQRVEILKALYRDAKILIMDEPTAVLTPQESDELFKILRGFTRENKSVIFISHKLKEVMAVSDRITVLRRGKVVDTLPVDQVNENLLAKLMVGREVIFQLNKKPQELGETLLEATHLTIRDSRGQVAVKDVSFAVQAGEIFGIAGVDGNGQAELIEAINGIIPVESGEVFLGGEKVTGNSPLDLYRRGLCHIPQDRRDQGLVLSLVISENLLLRDYEKKEYCRWGLIDRKKMHAMANRAIEDYDIRTPTCMLQAGNLSGGNQQKVVLARELSGNPSVIIAMHPTRGLDVGAAEYVQQKLIEARDRGAAVLLVSTELLEVLSLSDRVAVMYEGSLLCVVDPKEISTEKIGKVMAGCRLEDA